MAQTLGEHVPANDEHPLTILVVEGNTPELCAAGEVMAPRFADALTELDPRVVVAHTAPYEAASSSTADGPRGAELARELATSDCGDILRGVDGVAFTGSSVAWSTDAPEARPRRSAMAAALASGLPVWGSCDGLQLASVVLGGTVRASPRGAELGLALDVRPTGDGGEAHPMFAGRHDRGGRGFAAPCIHRDEMALPVPAGAVVLAANAHSAVQALAVEGPATITGPDGAVEVRVDFWGTQYHPECRPSDVAALMTTASDEAPAPPDDDKPEGALLGGLFREGAAASRSLAEDLFSIDTGTLEERAAAAARLGCSDPADLELPARASELACWLGHVKEAKARRELRGAGGSTCGDLG